MYKKIRTFDLVNSNSVQLIKESEMYIEKFNLFQISQICEYLFFVYFFGQNDSIFLQAPSLCGNDMRNYRLKGKGSNEAKQKAKN